MQIKKKEKPILVTPKVQAEDRSDRLGIWLEILLLFIGLCGYLFCNTTALGMEIHPVLVVLIGGIAFALMILFTWYKRVFFSLLGGLAAILLIAYPLTLRMARYIGRAFTITLNYIIYLLGSQEGYSGYLEQMTMDLSPYLKNPTILGRYLSVALVAVALVAALFYALALFKRIPVMVAFIVPIIGLVPLFFYGIVPHYIAFSVFLAALIGCYGQSVVQQMGRQLQRTARKAEKKSGGRKERKAKRARAATLTTEERFSFAASHGKFGMVVAVAMLLVTISTAAVIYSRPILQMEAFREKLDQVSNQALNVVFRKTYEKQLNVAGYMNEEDTVGMLMPVWRGLKVATVTSNTENPFYLRFRTTVNLDEDGWKVPDKAFLGQFQNSVSYDFYEYTQYYNYLCLTAESGDPIASALDNYYSEDQGYYTDQITVFPEYKVSDLLGLPAGITSNTPLSEFQELEREGDTILWHNDDPSDESYSFRVSAPTLESGLYLAKFNSAWEQYLTIRDDYGANDPYMAREAEYSSFVYENYCNIPEKLDATVGNLAWDITGVYSGRLEKVQSIERYLRENYKYAPTRKRVVRADGTPGDACDYIEYFLNQNKEKDGYCTLFASSMVAMLRDIGIPSRVVTGYYVDPTFQEVGSYTTALYDKNFHAWVEVYFDGAGWLTFEPTPGFGGVKNYYLLEVQDGTKEQEYSTQAEVEYVPPDNYVKYTNVLPPPSEPKEEEDLASTIMDALKLNTSNTALKIIIEIILWMMLVAAILFGIKWFHHFSLNAAKRCGPTEGTQKAYNMILRLMKMRGFKFFEGEALADFARRADNLELAPHTLTPIVPILEKSLYSDLAISEKERERVVNYLFALDRSLMRRVHIFKGVWYRLTLWKKPKYKGMIWRFK